MTAGAANSAAAVAHDAPAVHYAEVRRVRLLSAGFHWQETSTQASPLVGSLLLGLYNDENTLQHVGVVGATAKLRAELVDELEPLLVAENQDHPGTSGPVRTRTPFSDCPAVSAAGMPLLEVKYEHLEGTRFRHLAHFLRWRDDRTPESCTYTQLEQPLTFALGDIVPGLGG